MIWILVLFAIQIPLKIAASCVNGMYWRKEFRDMSDNEWQSFKSALRIYIASGNYASFASMHMDFFSTAHGGPMFLPWHRMMLAALERGLQQIDPSVSVPYWDWAADAWNPIGSGIFTEYYLGLEGGGWPMTVPNSHELFRSYDAANFGTLYDSAAIEAITSANTAYDDFRSALEGAPHSAVHVAIGGDMSSMYSPNDPIFYLHHAFVDKLWSDWQDRHTWFDYAGSLEHIIEPFGVTVGSVMDPGQLCYNYQRFSQRMSPDGFEISIPLPTVSDSKPLYLPRPLPLAWITMHHMNETEIRAQERNLTIVMTAQFNVQI